MNEKNIMFEEFIKAFRITYNFILLYSKEHKAFLNSLEELKIKLDSILKDKQQIEILISPEGVWFESVFYSKESFYKEVAQLLHQRKIKSIRFFEGVTTDELKILFEKLALPAKEIIQRKGLAIILGEEGNLEHCQLEDLDYSQLLHGQGQQIKDVWAFFMQEVISKEDLKKIDEFVHNFNSLLETIKPSQFLQDEQFSRHLHTFLDYLKKHNYIKFKQCLDSLLNAAINDSQLIKNENASRRLKEFLIDVSDEKFCEVLWQRLLSKEELELAQFVFLTKLIGKGTHQQIAAFLAEKANKENNQAIAFMVAQKLEKLFNLDKNIEIPPVYREAMRSFLERNKIIAEVIFDRQAVEYNYQLILLDLLSFQNSPKKAVHIVEKILKIWDSVLKENKFRFILDLKKIIEDKKELDKGFKEVFEELENRINLFLDSFIWQENPPQEVYSYLENIAESTASAEEYLRKIFEEGKVFPLPIKIYFKVFKNRCLDFYEYFRKKEEDIEFCVRIIEVIKNLELEDKITIFEKLYEVSNDFIKAEILRLMAQLGEYHKEFIFEILRNSTSYLKKEALTVITEQNDTQRALDILLGVENKWGKNNKTIIENLSLLAELQYRQAIYYLDYLEKKTPFWNFPLRNKIRETKVILNG
ncbi:MAG: hypothetical protein N2606_06475 [Candidatus Omnitrophica bacterium]|nr:hypothetical protein [Candidatus Omnitrophota bacterium]